MLKPEQMEKVWTPLHRSNLSSDVAKLAARRHADVVTRVLCLTYGLRPPLIGQLWSCTNTSDGITTGERWNDQSRLRSRHLKRQHFVSTQSSKEALIFPRVHEALPEVNVTLTHLLPQKLATIWSFLKSVLTAYEFSSLSRSSAGSFPYKIFGRVLPGKKC